MAVGVRIVDLDARPELRSAALAVLTAAGPGQQHLVTGLAHRMGLPPTVRDLDDCLAVLCACQGPRLLGVLAICAYSKEQTTLWGPSAPGAATPTARLLLAEARRLLRSSGFESARVLVDTRNRPLRSLLLGQGFTPWKDSLVFERSLAKPPEPVEGVRLAREADRVAVTGILTAAFRDSDHCRPSLAAREKEGYRHYVLELEDRVVAAAAVRRSGLRSWLKLIAVKEDRRVQRLGSRLLQGLLASEGAANMSACALEVLADNRSAIALYTKAGFEKRFTATVLTAPV